MPDALIKSAKRVFDILELFRRRKAPLRLKEIVDALRLPTSSVAALLKTMTQLNYLSFDSALRTYSPTIRLAELGRWVTLSSFEGGPVQETIRRISRKIGETIVLGTVNDIYVEIVDMVRPRKAIQYHQHIGSKVLLVHSGMGWSFLSELDDDDVIRIYRKTLSVKSGGPEIASLSRLMREIKQVRKAGYCASRGMVTEGVGTIGMVLPTPVNHRRLAIGVAGPQERIDRNLPKILAAIHAEKIRLATMAAAP
jgi:IclR family transcriptional regulator, KDG regulon repressor